MAYIGARAVGGAAAGVPDHIHVQDHVLLIENRAGRRFGHEEELVGFPILHGLDAVTNEGVGQDGLTYFPTLHTGPNDHLTRRFNA